MGCSANVCVCAGGSPAAHHSVTGNVIVCVPGAFHDSKLYQISRVEKPSYTKETQYAVLTHRASCNTPDTSLHITTKLYQIPDKHHKRQLDG